MNRSMIRNFVLSGVVLILIILVVVPQFRDEEDEFEAPRQFLVQDGYIYLPETSPIRERIETGYVKTDTVSLRVSAPAVLELNPKNMVNIFPPAGGRIVRIFAEIGQEIRKGQALFEIYSPDIIEAQTEYIAAKNAASLAENELARKKALHERGIVSQREIEEAKSNFEIAKGEINGALLKLQLMDLDEEEIGKPLIVRSPINGRLVDLNVAQGVYISEADEPLMVIADLKKLWLTANIQEKDLGFVNMNNKVNAIFTAYPSDVYNGKVMFISDILDSETRTVKVRAEFDNYDHKLKPGMYANAFFHSEPVETVLLDPRAVLQRRDYNYVYVQKDDFLFEKRKVILGDLIDDIGKIIILSGLTPDEKIVTTNAILLP